jgi:hypothetical protein
MSRAPLRVSQFGSGKRLEVVEKRSDAIRVDAAPVLKPLVNHERMQNRPISVGLFEEELCPHESPHIHHVMKSQGMVEVLPSARVIDVLDIVYNDAILVGDAKLVVVNVEVPSELLAVGPGVASSPPGRVLEDDVRLGISLDLDAQLLAVFLSRSIEGRALRRARSATRFASSSCLMMSRSSACGSSSAVMFMRHSEFREDLSDLRRFLASLALSPPSTVGDDFDRAWRRPWLELAAASLKSMIATSLHGETAPKQWTK